MVSLMRTPGAVVLPLTEATRRSSSSFPLEVDVLLLNQELR